MSKKKKTSTGYKNSGKRTYTKEKPESFLNLKPTWAFCRHRHKEEWTCCCEDFYKNCLPKMISYESMTWNEIIRETHDKSGKSCHHYITELNSYTSEAQRKLKQYEKIYSIDRLFSLRIDNKRRLIGFLEKGIFYIFWYDQEHKSTRTKRNKNG